MLPFFCKTLTHHLVQINVSRQVLNHIKELVKVKYLQNFDLRLSFIFAIAYSLKLLFGLDTILLQFEICMLRKDLDLFINLFNDGFHDLISMLSRHTST